MFGIWKHVLWYCIKRAKHKTIPFNLLREWAFVFLTYQNIKKNGGLLCYKIYDVWKCQVSRLILDHSDSPLKLINIKGHSSRIWTFKWPFHRSFRKSAVGFRKFSDFEVKRHVRCAVGLASSFTSNVSRLLQYFFLLVASQHSRKRLLRLLARVDTWVGCTWMFWSFLFRDSIAIKISLWYVISKFCLQTNVPCVVGWYRAEGI